MAGLLVQIQQWMHQWIQRSNKVLPTIQKVKTEPGEYPFHNPRSSPPGCFECFIRGIDILSRTDKTVTIEMNHMIRGIEEVGKGCVK